MPVIDQINYDKTTLKPLYEVKEDSDFANISIDNKKINNNYPELKFYLKNSKLENANKDADNFPPIPQLTEQGDNNINPYVRLLQHLYQNDILVHANNSTYGKDKKVYLNSLQLTCLAEQLNYDANPDDKQSVFRAPFVEKNGERPYLLKKEPQERSYFRDFNFLESQKTFGLSTYVYSNDIIGDNLGNKTLLHKLINKIGLSITNAYYYQDILNEKGYNKLTTLFSKANMVHKSLYYFEKKGTNNIDFYIRNNEGYYLRLKQEDLQNVDSMEWGEWGEKTDALIFNAYPYKHKISGTNNYFEGEVDTNNMGDALYVDHLYSYYHIPRNQSFYTGNDYYIVSNNAQEVTKKDTEKNRFLKIFSNGDVKLYTNSKEVDESGNYIYGYFEKVSMFSRWSGNVGVQNLKKNSNLRGTPSPAGPQKSSNPIWSKHYEGRMVFTRYNPYTYIYELLEKDVVNNVLKLDSSNYDIYTAEFFNSIGQYDSINAFKNVNSIVSYEIAQDVIRHLIFMKAYTEYLSEVIYYRYMSDETFKKFYKLIIYHNCNQIVDFFIANLFEINVGIKDHFNELFLLEMMMLKEKLYQERVHFKDFVATRNVDAAFQLEQTEKNKLSELVINMKYHDSQEQKYSHDLNLQHNKNMEYNNQKRYLRNMYILYICLIVVYSLFMIYYILNDMPYMTANQKSMILIIINGIIAISIIGNELRKLMIEQQMIEGFFDNGTVFSASSIYSLFNARDLTEFRDIIDTYHRGKIKLFLKRHSWEGQNGENGNYYYIVYKYNSHRLNVPTGKNSLELVPLYDFRSGKALNELHYFTKENKTDITYKTYILKQEKLSWFATERMAIPSLILDDAKLDSSMTTNIIDTSNNTVYLNPYIFFYTSANYDKVYILDKNDKGLVEIDEKQLLLVHQGISQLLGNYNIINEIYNNNSINSIDINYLSKNKAENNLKLKNLNQISEYQYRLLDFSYNQYIYLTNYLKIITIALATIFILVNMAEHNYMNRGLSVFVIIFIMVIIFSVIIIHKTTEVRKKEYDYNQYAYKRIGSI